MSVSLGASSVTIFTPTNPAFLGFDFMYIGVLLMYCNLLTAAFSLFAIITLHLQILQEEQYLTGTFGITYQKYMEQVHR